MRVRESGPLPSDFYCLSDYPGKQESAKGYPLLGKTGDEVNRYLDGQKLPARREWRLANLIREWNPANEYAQSDVDRDAPDTLEDIRATKPKCIVTLGRWSARWLLGDVDVEAVNAMPWLLPNPEHYGCELGTVAFPMFNPAAGFRSPETQAQVSYGFGQLALFLQGAIEPRRLFHDEHPEPVYREITDVAHLLCVLGSSTTIYVDSEGHPDRVWSVQFALKPGVAYLIRMKQTEVMRAFFQWLIRTKPRITYHGSLHDFGIMRAVMVALGIPIDALYDIAFDDTQIMAYLLQLEPIGLKPNCVRHCGMQMQSYDEVLGDAQDNLARDYLVGVFDAEQADYEVRQQEAFEEINRTPLVDKDGKPKLAKDGSPRFRRTTVLPGLPRTDLHKAAERVLRSRTPFKLWNGQREDIQVAGYACLGEMPQATLDHVSYETAKHYACRDADGTARLAPQLHSRLKALDLESVYRLELSTYPLIDRMMMVGVRPNLPHFANLGWKLQGHIEELQARLEDATNRPTFNANSGDQVADYLFDSLGLPGYKKTPEGRQSTNDKILEALEREFGVQYPEISLIREYRETYKLKHTFCVVPETRVLTRNLTWRQIGDLRVGEVLLGFDENTRRGKGNDHHRHWRRSVVTATKRVTKPCYRLTFSDGTVVTCTDDHRWLARSTSSYEKAVWVRTDQICLEDRPRQTRHQWEVIKPLDVWQLDNSFDAGWLSGLLDGEGCLQRPRYSMRAVFTQNPGPILTCVKALLADYGFSFAETTSGRTRHLTISKVADAFRLLGIFRPIRLLHKFREIVDQDRLPRVNMSASVAVVSREYVGEREVVALTTSTGTFVAEGLASHNCDRVPDFTRRWPHDNRVHATFRTTRVVTGRLAASDPNLLAQPEHGQFAPDFKRGWEAEEGRVVAAWDESQIELRVLAHLSQDPVLLRAYREGTDLHAALAERIFGIRPGDQDKSRHRLPAKAINFGIPMGMQAQGLTIELRKNGVMVDEDDAQRWLDETNKLYAGVQIYKDRMISEARRNGYIRCLSGRIRYIGGIASWDRILRAEAERYAFSTPIQEGAQWLLKTAEAHIWEIIRDYHRAGYWVEPLMQVHDCIKLEMEEGLQHEVNVMMRWAMIDALDGMLSVPLGVDGEWGLNFADMEKF